MALSLSKKKKKVDASATVTEQDAHDLAFHSIWWSSRTETEGESAHSHRYEQTPKLSITYNKVLP